jgi:hypothetical protein
MVPSEGWTAPTTSWLAEKCTCAPNGVATFVSSKTRTLIVSPAMNVALLVLVPVEIVKVLEGVVCTTVSWFGSTGAVLAGFRI